MSMLKHLAVTMMVATTAKAFDVIMKQSQSVFEGDPLELLCETDRPIDSCEFRLQGFTEFKLKVYKGVKKPSYAFFGDFQHGVCGIRIFSANRTNHGPATCQVTYPNEDDFGEGRCNVTVQHMPKNVKLRSNKPNFEFEEGDLMEFKCTADGGFPPPTITLLYNWEIVSDTTTSNSSSWSKVADVSDFDKRIECVVAHPNKTRDEIFFSSRFITVEAAPKLICKLEDSNVCIATGNFTVGQNATILVPVRAYPMPQLIEWTRAGQKLDKARFRPWQYTKKFLLGKFNEWIFGLEITTLTDDDLTKIFEISIWNELGQQSFPLKIVSRDVVEENTTASGASTPTKQKISCLINLSAPGLLCCLHYFLSCPIAQANFFLPSASRRRNNRSAKRKSVKN